MTAERGDVGVFVYGLDKGGLDRVLSSVKVVPSKEGLKLRMTLLTVQKAQTWTTKPIRPNHDTVQHVWFWPQRDTTSGSNGICRALIDTDHRVLSVCTSGTEEDVSGSLLTGGKAKQMHPTASSRIPSRTRTTVFPGND